MHPAKTFFFFLFLIFPRLISAQASIAAYNYSITIDLQNVSEDKDRVKVTVLPPAVSGPVVKYILPTYLPGVPGKVDAGRFIHQFYAIDDRGFQLKVKKKGENTILLFLKKGETLRKIEYWIDDTWDAEKVKAKESDEKFNYVPQCAGTNIDAGNNFVLNHAFIFGYLEGLANIPYNITIIKPDELESSSYLKIIHQTRSRDEYHAATYYELIDNPVMYSRPDTCSFSDGRINISVSVFSENGKISARLVRRLIAAQTMANLNFIGDIGEQNFKMIFYFTTPFKTILNKYGSYGGLAHRHCSFYFMSEIADEDELESEVQRVTSGDILHLLSPLDYLSSCGSGDLSKPQMSSSWWFCQGANMYLGWLSAVRDSFTSENEFMGAVSAKIRLSLVCPEKPVSDVVNAITMMKSPLRREGIRAKAMLVAFLLDIEITKATGGKTGLRELILQMNANGRIPPDSLEKKIIQLSDPAIAGFFRDYVNGIKPLPLIKDLEAIGWAYAPSSIDSVLTFGQFGLLYDDEKDAFLIHNADTTNLFGLRNGDRLLSVDGVVVGAANFDEALLPVYSPTDEQIVEIRFIRNDQNMVASSYPMEKTVLIDYFIKADPAANDDELLLHDRIFHPLMN
ncbi:MAG: hypothetical protein HY064_04970 [Bacteroidetes bacterium]|nr:hypothetical protein [Bacteroidota bacterium]